MAKREIIPGDGICLVLTPAETVELVTLLIAQVADVTPVGRMAGACPTINIIEHGQRIDRVSFVVGK